MEMSVKEETVEVTVKVPKRLMELIEEAKYFGWSKQDFFTVCVKCGVSSELGDLTYEEEKPFRSKYDDELWTVYPSEKKVLL